MKKTDDLLKYVDTNLIKRFSQKVKPSIKNDCLEWSAFTNLGYGVFKLGGHNGFTVRAHRMSWVIAHNTNIPTGMFVCHSCDNPKCVNSQHLWLGTHLENQQDKARKSRGNSLKIRGELNAKAKLTTSQVKYIRNSKFSPVDLAIKFKVSKETIKTVLSRRSWNHVT